jgi:hypothetical protein
MSCSDELNATFGDGACGESFELSAHFVDHDDFWHVVLNAFDHHLVLQASVRYLHTPSMTDCWVRNIAVASDFV